VCHCACVEVVVVEVRWVWSGWRKYGAQVSGMASATGSMMRLHGGCTVGKSKVGHEMLQGIQPRLTIAPGRLADCRCMYRSGSQQEICCPAEAAGPRRVGIQPLSEDGCRDHNAARPATSFCAN